MRTFIPSAPFLVLSLALILALPALLLSACATSPTSRAEPGTLAASVPDDFWLSLTVMAPTANPAAPRAERPARYLVEADRILRVLVGSGASEYVQPPQLRQLSESQFLDLYNAFRASGAPEAQGETSVAPTREELNDRHLIVLSYRLNARRRTIVIDAAQAPDQAAKLTALADHLAELAWIPKPH